MRGGYRHHVGGSIARFAIDVGQEPMRYRNYR
jgi:hypothetical protein